MIKIRVTEENGLIRSLSISGHAGYAEKGKDLVCAAVSGIAFGLCNAVDAMVPNARIEVKENHIVIDVMNPTKESNYILKTGVISFQTVEESNRDYVKMYMEV